MKKKILCLVGGSGSGKSLLQTYLEKEWNIKPVISYTTRGKRSPDEGGHYFVTEKDYESTNKEDMLAYTKYGDYHYWSLEKDLEDVNCYVIDEYGLKILKSIYGNKYDIISVRLIINDYERYLRGIDEERIRRDNNKLISNIEDYDYVINNNHSVFYLTDNIDSIVKEEGLNVLEKE